MKKENENLLEKVVSLCKRRGFVFPGSEIYGGLANSWDLGHLGNELFNNIASLWWKTFVQERDDIVGLRGPVIMNPKVWEASGHLQSFTDPLVECKICHERFRQDKEEELKEHAELHKGKAEWTEPKNFNLLFKTYIGPVEDQQHLAYLRGELAQTMFTDFKTILETTRKRLPFGIAQIGKAFRNEITTGNFIFRTKEFTIAELEYFVKPGTEDEHYKNWDELLEKFLTDNLMLDKNKIRRYVHPKEKLAHYSKGTADLEYEFPFGWGELTGLASRTDFDLKNHEKLSGQNLKYRDPETEDEFLPYVVEPTCGLERLMLAVLVNSYEEVEARSGDEEAVHEKEVVLRLPRVLAPIKVAVLPLSRKEELTKPSYQIYRDLQKHFMCQYDETASIGKRYRRQDEIGTPFCVTYDFDSINDKKVTVRDRDTMEQERIEIANLSEHLLGKLNS
ncbi:MAG: glycine--tRNA ligase [Candidatus Yanofskybacteria bacterium]|nr:glycine--tRNA ligase [Candidatus Yanofskybacteria bacterium]